MNIYCDHYQIMELRINNYSNFLGGGYLISQWQIGNNYRVYIIRSVCYDAYSIQLN